MTELKEIILNHFRLHSFMKDRNQHTINELLYVLNNPYFSGAHISISIKTEDNRWYCIPSMDAFVSIPIRSIWFNDDEFTIDEEFIDDILFTCITITAIPKFTDIEEKMPVYKIDNINDIDFAKLNHENLRVKYWTGQNKTEIRHQEKIDRYRHGAMTNLGDIELSVWIRLVKLLIIQSNEQELYKQLYDFYINHEMAHFNWNEKDIKKEKERAVMDIYTRRLFNNPEWACYNNFKQYQKNYNS